MKSIIEEYIARRLKERGFKKKGQRWWLDAGPSVFPIIRIERLWFNKEKGVGKRWVFLAYFIGNLDEVAIPSAKMVQHQEIDLVDIVRLRSHPELDGWVERWRRIGGDPRGLMESAAFVWDVLDDNSALEWKFRKNCIDFLLDELLFPAIPEPGTVNRFAEIVDAGIVSIDWFDFPKNVRAKIRRKMSR